MDRVEQIRWVKNDKVCDVPVKKIFTFLTKSKHLRNLFTKVSREKRWCIQFTPTVNDLL